MATKKTEVSAKAKKAAPAAKAAPAVKATVKKTPEKKVPATKKTDERELIRMKAEEIYHARVARSEHGTADGDWHLAEKLVKAGAKKAVAKKPAAKKK